MYIHPLLPVQNVVPLLMELVTLKQAGSPLFLSGPFSADTAASSNALVEAATSEEIQKTPWHRAFVSPYSIPCTDYLPMAIPDKSHVAVVVSTLLAGCAHEPRQPGQAR